MSRFDEDKADHIVNTKILEQEFDMTDSTTEQEIQQMRNSIEEAEQIAENMENPDEILLNNIERANRFLDMAEAEVGRGGINARLLEVCSQLINSVTSAANSIVGSSQSDAELEIKQKRLELEERKLAVKEALGSKQPISGNTFNVITTDRESVLKYIAEERKKEEEYIETKPVDND